MNDRKKRQLRFGAAAAAFRAVNWCLAGRARCQCVSVLLAIPSAPAAARNRAGQVSVLNDKLVFGGLKKMLSLRTQTEACHCEPVRTLAWQSPGFSGYYNRTPPFYPGFRKNRDCKGWPEDPGDCHTSVRLIKLNQIAIQQMKILEGDDNRKLIK